MIKFLKKTTSHEYLFFLIPFVTALLFAIVSNHVWEDFLITFRFSRNLAQGNGLVYETGLHVHGFTSFFNTLIPAFFDWIFKTDSIYPALWVYRLICIIVFAMACSLMASTWKGLGVRSIFVWLGLIILALDVKMVDFTINGQEVAFMLFFVAMALRIVSDDRWNSPLYIGLCAAGFMYSRPDGFLYASAIFGFFWLFRRGEKLFQMLKLIKGAAISVVLYAPWMVFVWWYYGSPIPNTISAKVGAYTESIFGNPISDIFSTFPQVLFMLFNPVYEDSYFEPYSGVLFEVLIFGLLILGLFLGQNKKLRVFTSVCVGALVLMTFYLSYGGVKVGMVFPWYMPAVSLFAVGGLILAIDGVFSRIKGSAQKWSLVIPVTLAGIAVLSYAGGVLQLSTHQRFVENGVRKAVGVWLSEHAAEGDSVHSEPIGYIGFYSKLKVYDWPGLQSPEVVELRHQYGNRRDKVIKALMPDWLVLRPYELLQLSQLLKFEGAYDLAMVFDQIPELDARPWIPGNRYHYVDAKYYVFKRVGESIEERSIPEQQ